MWGCGSDGEPFAPGTVGVRRRVILALLKRPQTFSQPSLNPGRASCTCHSLHRADKAVRQIGRGRQVSQVPPLSNGIGCPATVRVVV